MFSALRESIASATDSAKDVAAWTFGISNLSAIKDVVTGDYNHAYGQGTPSAKLKQIGTEILHGALKLSIPATYLDTTLTRFNFIAAPKFGTIRHAGHFVTSTLNSYAVPAVGLFAIGSALKNVGSSFYQAKEHWDAGVVRSWGFHEENLPAFLNETVTMAISLPVFAAAYQYGLTGAAVSALPFLTAQNSESTRAKVAFLTASVALYMLNSYLTEDMCPAPDFYHVFKNITCPA